MGILDQMDEGVNFAGVQAPSFDALKAGWYHCSVTDIQHGESSAESKKYPNCPMMNVEWTIQSGPHENRRFWRNYLLHPDFLGYLKGFFEAAGFSEEEIDAEGFDPDDDEILGKEMDVKVNRKKSNYTGDYENNVNGLAPVGTKVKGEGGSNGDSLMP